MSQKHSFISEINFRVRVSLFIFSRLIKNGLIQRIPVFKKGNKLDTAPVIALSESELWNADDNDDNWILTAGKIENLRVAARRLNGLEVRAGDIFSFWQHIKMPIRMRGFVVGREIREGCIVPTIAGGLCQLSNALYDAALKAGFEIVERHRHTRVIKGSLAEYDKDATVKWNYIDLRFKAAADFKIEIDFTAEKLFVTLKSSQQTGGMQTASDKTFNFSKLNDCYSCGNTLCFKHPGEILSYKQKRITTFILDEKWAEYDEYVRKISLEDDYFIVPFSQNSRLGIPRYSWPVKKQHYSTFLFLAIQRAFFIRRAAKSNGNIPSSYLKYDRKIVNSLKRAIPVKTTHIVITQNLLPFAWQQGILWGRTFDVLMTRLPMEILHRKLDDAHLMHRESKTLSDFRAGSDLVSLENIALTRAQHIITPHQQIAEIFNNKSVKLNWILPATDTISRHNGSKILFPAPVLARKGAYEIKRLAQELKLDLVITGGTHESESFWQGVNVTIAGPNIFDDIKLVVLPTYVEHQPRLLLKALALNIPVVATDACGIGIIDNLTIVSTGDYDALKNAVLNIYQKKETLTEVQL